MKRFNVLALIALTLSSASVARRAVPQGQAQSLRSVPLTVATMGGVRRFNVEVARTASEQSRGLMFRRSLAPSRGMIFPMQPPRFASFWMRNTLIPLDLLFIRGDGTIANIAARAKPLDLSPIESVEPVAAVLELAGGRAEQLGIKPGDRVTTTALR